MLKLERLVWNDRGCECLTEKERLSESTMCLRERERERERDKVCVDVYVGKIVHRERKREKESVCICCRKDFSERERERKIGRES